MTDPAAPEVAAPELSVDHVRSVLAGVVDPELGSDIVELGMVRDIQIAANGDVEIEVALTTAGCPLKAHLQREVRARVGSLPGVHHVRLVWSELTAEQKSAAMAIARRNVAEGAGDTAIAPTTRVLLVASGKGGVGKSSVTTNLAAGMAARGYRVGVIDADIWGHSIPRMVGAEGRLEGDTTTKQIRPNQVPMADGHLEVVSMGFLVETEETALMWRGLILQRAVQHFLEDVAWSPDLDYILIDMPPGTGDVQMGLAKMLPRAEMLVVTTPSTTAQKVAIRAVNMARQNYLRVVGAIENMSEFVTPSGERFAVFGSGGGDHLARDAGIELIGRVPIELAVAHGGDTGHPVVLGSGPAAESFRAIVDRLVTDLVPPNKGAGCSNRILAAVEDALSAQNR